MEVEESLELMGLCFLSCSAHPSVGATSALQLANEDGLPPHSQTSVPRGGIFYDQTHHLGFIYPPQAHRGCAVTLHSAPIGHYQCQSWHTD